MKFAIKMTALYLLISCGREDSPSIAACDIIKNITIPGKIQAEDFSSAIDHTQGNRGVSCAKVANSNVDLLVPDDEGGGCGIGWTQDGERLDYFVENKEKGLQVYDLDLRLASASASSKVTIESPAGNVIGEARASCEGCSLGWQNWVTRSLRGIKIHPGRQVIRVIFHGENNLNYLVLRQKGVGTSVSPKPAPVAPGGGEIKRSAEDLIKEACSSCHGYLLNSDRSVNWDAVAKNAERIKSRLSDSVSPMPPREAPAGSKLSSSELVELKAKVESLLSQKPELAKPIASLKFESRGMKLQRDLMAEGVGHIWGMVFLPNGDILMTLKTGGLKSFSPGTRRIVNIAGAPNAAQHGQGGLLDVGLSKNFNNDRKIFLSYAKDLGSGHFTTALGSGTISGDRLTDFKEIFVAKGSSTLGEHFGGRLVVDGDSIWLSVGERNVRENAQKLDNHLGKVLRLTAEGRAHPDNPFHWRAGALAEIYSYGHRNPQGLTKNQLTGEIWESEHGPKGGDEINRVVKGGNFGWPLTSYGINYDGTFLGPTSFQGTIQPLEYWNPSIAPSGLVVYSSDYLSGWKGAAISGSLALQHLNLSWTKSGTKAVDERLFGSDGLRIREVEMGPTGELWYSSDNGKLFRIKKSKN